MTRIKITLLLLLTISFSSSWAQLRVDDVRFDLTKFSQFFNYLNENYVDTINRQSLIEGAITGVLSKLDPHSAYVSAKEMKSIQESFSGNFEGIGIEFGIINDTLVVVNTIVGGPSEKVGLMSNDRIIMVDGKSVVGIKQGDVPGVLKGPKGTRIVATIVRSGIKKPMEFVIIRDKIPIYTLDASYMIDKNTGYVRLNRFAATTTAEFLEALAKMGNPQNLILDLRGNGGGFLDQAVKLSSQFIEPYKVVVSTEGRNVAPEKLISEGYGAYRHGNLIVLMDESSASASEIVSGAIQDWDRGLIVGRRSFGKGLVQRQIPLIDGSAVRITIARYHTPTGRVIQRAFENGKTDEYYKELATRNDSKIDPSKMADSLKYRTLKKGRMVYGGGGITPDVIVPIDTMGYTKYWAMLVRSGSLSEFVLDYVEKNRASIHDKYKTPDEYIVGYEVTEPMLSRLIAIGEKNNVKANPVEMKKSHEEIRRQIKALVAHKMWDMTAYYKVINRHDKDVLKATEVFNNWSKYSNL